MSTVKQKGNSFGMCRNLSIPCSAFLANLLLIGILSTAPLCIAKIETKIKLLNDDYSVPASTKTDDYSYSFSSDFQQSKLQKNDLKRISFETIHNILRDRNAPMSYRINDLRYFRKRSSRTPEHGISKRSLELTIKQSTSAETALNLTNRNLYMFSHEIVNTSRPFEEITSIILHKNNLQEFPLSSFPNITLLDLSENNFTNFNITSQAANLRFLNLNKNRVQNFTISATNKTQGKHMIRELHLKDNAIHIVDQMNLGLAKEIEVLDLSCNQIKILDTGLFSTQMTNLKHLNLAHNKLKSIHKETFDNLINLNTLILSHNEINEINYETFLALPNLQYLDLSNNELKGDTIRALQGIPDLVGLSIANNLELGDSMQEFVASWSLKELDASGTGLCKIPAVLAQSVRMLKLAHNWLTIISCGDLDSYPLLQYLDLSYSHIDDIEEDALGRLEALERLFLDHNNLKKIPISLPTTLEHLFLQNNQIMDVPLQSFQGLNNLKTLDLSSNKLIYLPDLPLPKLITLNLQSSGINGLHQGIVKTSPHLRDLFLEDNPIKCAELLGITEWASPCRNDRRTTKRIEIKLFYVQAHNYFERFQCTEVDGQLCATCLREIHSPENKIYPQPYCANFNRTILQKTSTQSTTAKTTGLFTKERTIFYKTKGIVSTTSKPENYSVRNIKNNRNEAKSLGTASPEVSKSKMNINRKVQTTSQTKIQTSKNGNLKLLHPPSLKLQLESDKKSNKTYKTSEHNIANLSEINQIRKRNDANIPITENYPVTISSSAPVTTEKSQYVSQISTTKKEAEIFTSTETNTFHNIPMDTISKTISKKILKLQIKDRHLIGTPLLMHKGHIVQFPSVHSALQAKKLKDANLLHIPSSQDSKHSIESGANGKTPLKKSFEKPHNNNVQLDRNLYNTGNQKNGSQLFIMEQNKHNPKSTGKNQTQTNSSTEPNNSSELQTKSNGESQKNSHSLNTPIKLKTDSDALNIFLESYYDFDTINQSKNTESATHYHSRVNKPVSVDENIPTNIRFESHSASTNFSESSKTALIPENDNNIISERWLDVRNAKKHPGLAAVIVVTFAMVFVVALLKVYRHRKKPLSYLNHQQRYGHQNQNQYQHQKENLLPGHHHQHHQLRVADEFDNKRCYKSKSKINQNQYSTEGCVNDFAFSKSKSAYKSIPNQALFKNQDLSQTPTSNNNKFKKGKCSFGVFKNDYAKNNYSNNYRSFPGNEKRNKDNHLSQFERNDFCIDINHVQQSVLATNLFPMELLMPQASVSSSPPFSQKKQISGLISEEYKDYSENQETRSLEEEFDGINFEEKSESEKSTFEIW